jgi:hypothetical protein
VKFAHIALGIAVSAGLVAALSPKAESVPDKVAGRFQQPVARR